MKILLGFVLAWIAAMLMNNQPLPQKKTPDNLAVYGVGFVVDALMAPTVILPMMSYSQSGMSRAEFAGDSAESGRIAGYVRAAALSLAFYSPFLLAGIRKQIPDGPPAKKD